MIELRLLGPVRIAGPSGTDVDALLQQPKRLALLSYLALSSSTEPWVSRDSLLALFWPESDERRAREALRQGLRFLRRSLGSDVLVTRGRSWVGVSREHVRCDVWQFEALLASGEPAGALELYGGELLQGVEVRGAVAFDQWLSERRRELTRQAAGVAWSLTEAARDEGDLASALARGRRARELDPADEEGVRRLMGLQLAAGDRAGALQVYGEFEEWLAAHFDAVPSVRTRDLAQRARGAAGSALPSAGPWPAPGTRSGSVSRAAPSGGAGSSGSQGQPNRTARTVLTGAVVVIAIMAVAFTSNLVLSARPPAYEAEASDERLVVVPFQVSEADPSLSFLRHGMGELFAAVFRGDMGPATVPWPRDSGRRSSVDDSRDPAGVARSLGARWLVQGEVMGNQRDVRLSAALTDVEGREPPLMAAVAGPADSVYALARELSLRLLAMQVGVPEEEAARLARTTPAALHAYLRGRRALHRAQYQEADRRFDEALRHDSLFAQAAVGLVETHLAAPWVRGHISELALPLAYRLRHRLGPADREFVRAAAGPRYPETSTQAEYFRAWERAVARVPERASVWYQWGEALFHAGPFLGIPDHRERAAAAFEHALELDPDNLLPLTHLVELATEAGDADRGAELLQRLLRGSEPNEPVNADYLRWRVALAAGDTGTLSMLRARFETLDAAGLGGVVRAASFLGQGLDDADRIAALDLNRWTSPSERWTMLHRLHAHALNRGRPSVALALTDAMPDVAPIPNVQQYLRIRAAQGAGGDPAAAREAAAQLEAHVDLGPVSEQARRPGLVGDVCALEVWKASNGDLSTTRSAIGWLRDKAGPAAPDDPGPHRCAVFLEALLAKHQRPHRLADAIARVQVLVDQGVQLPGAGPEPLWLFLAHALERQGDLDGALRAVRRRSSEPFMLAEQLRLEGRLAALAGDTAAARAAYAHYLALREDPEPALRAEVLGVRQAYEALGVRVADG
jgi:DNA-binding SARP family transcriptional activator/tetratricopeptide (TPR) repeat protein/TolB-like protein